MLLKLNIAAEQREIRIFLDLMQLINAKKVCSENTLIELTIYS